MNKKKPRPQSSTSTVAGLYASALQHHQAGQGDAAVDLLKKILRVAPRNIAALNLLAIIAAQTGRLEKSEQYFRKILTIQPDDPEAHSNLGNVLFNLGRVGQAEAAYLEALRLRPAYPEAAYNLGRLLHQNGRPEEAEGHYRRAIQLRASAAAHTALALLLKERGRTDEAEQSLLQAVRLDPHSLEAINGLALIRQEAGQFQEAEALLRQALQISPGAVTVLANLGGLLQQTQRWTEAETLLRGALRVQPDAWEVLINLGVTLHRLKRLEEAKSAFLEVLRLKPDCTAGHKNLGSVLSELAAIYLATCDWPSVSELTTTLPQDIRARRLRFEPLTLMALADDAELQRVCAETYGQRWSVGCALNPHIPRHSDPKIRIAYLSGDFREHAVGRLIHDLMALHDRSRFDITAVSFGPETTDRLRADFIRNCDRFIDVRTECDLAVAQQLRDLEIDIAVDLAGYTLHSRTGILAHRPAPIQVNYLGFPGTMGVPFIDYVLADRVIIPETAQPGYREKVAYLPDTFLVTSRWEIAENTPSRHDLGLPEEAFVFCCFNNCNKIGPDFFDIWMRLLSEVGGSVLWLSSESDQVRANLRREAQARGIDPGRLVFAGKLPLPEHLARYRQADLFLDTLPRNATTTAADCLWAGLPVLTCTGSTYAARACASLLHAVGIPELVAASRRDYEASALRLARQPTELAALRTKLRHNAATHPLFDTGRFRRNIESAYSAMWRIWRNGEAPRSFTVET